MIGSNVVLGSVGVGGFGSKMMLRAIARARAKRSAGIWARVPAPGPTTASAVGGGGGSLPSSSSLSTFAATSEGIIGSRNDNHQFSQRWHRSQQRQQQQGSSVIIPFYRQQRQQHQQRRHFRIQTTTTNLKHTSSPLPSTSTFVCPSSTITSSAAALPGNERSAKVVRPGSGAGSRHFSSSSRVSSEPSPSSSSSALQLRDDLLNSAGLPCFGLKGEEVEVLSEPKEFRERLMTMIATARRRIMISSLYIGTEQKGELIEALRRALATNPHLRLSVICDFLRSTRESPPQESTASLLLELVREFGADRVECVFFRSPNLRGWREKMVPRRFDEGWGLWHCKWYVADDEVVFSGANLSRSYFEDRQDRYYRLTHQPTLASYLHSLFRLYAGYSYRLLSRPPPSSSPHFHVPLGNAGAALVWPEPSIHPRGFQQHARATLTAFQRYWRQTIRVGPERRGRYTAANEDSGEAKPDTWLFPMIQSGVLGMREEELGLDRVFAAAERSQGAGDSSSSALPTIDLTSGYFGLYAAYKSAILRGRAPCRIIAASPEANGFFGSAGVSRLIPEGYTLLEQRFERDVIAMGRREDVSLAEWKRPGWTYHAKGVWLRDTPDTSPFMTFIGSSNLSTRSAKLDIELSSILVTTNPSLQSALDKEVQGLRQWATEVGEAQGTWDLPERKVSWLATALVALGVEGML